MNINLKQVYPYDLDILVSISKSTFYESFQHLNDPIHFDAYCAAAFTPEQLLSELNNPDSEFYFAYDGNTLSGYIKLNYNQAQNEFKGKDSLEVERIYVSAELQGKLIGQKLLNFAVARAIEKALSFIWLGVWEHNPAAIRFYQRHGFELCGSHDFFIGGDKQTDLLMRHLIW
jgi:hypothetical protein